jgi:hypothetical protein
MIGSLTKAGGIVGGIVVGTYLEVPVYWEPHQFGQFLGIAVEYCEGLVTLE